MTNSKVISICVVGGAGRMGRRVIELCNELESVNVASVLVRPDDKAEGIGMVRVETEPRLAFEGCARRRFFGSVCTPRSRRWASVA